MCRLALGENFKEGILDVTPDRGGRQCVTAELGQSKVIEEESSSCYVPDELSWVGQSEEFLVPNQGRVGLTEKTHT